LSSVSQIIRRRQRRRRESRPGPALIGGIGGLAVFISVIAVSVGVATAAGVAGYFGAASVIPADPQAARPTAVGSGEPTLLLDRDARHILFRVTDPLNGEVPWVALADLPPYVGQAAVAIEDGDYFARPGFSVGGLADALFAAVTGGQAPRDPILLYLIRHAVLPLSQMPADHPDRPLTEAVLLLELRRRFSREDLLAWYLNTAFYGNGAYGIEAAARVYLGKGAAELTLGEAALLAGIPASPSVNPFDQPQTAHRRQEVVLDAMVAYGFIGPEEADSAGAAIDVTRPVAPADVVAPHFALLARRQAESLLNEAGYDGARLMAGGGLRVTTSLDLDLQYQTECVLRTQVARLGGIDPTFVYTTAIGEPCTAADLLPALDRADVGVPHLLSNGAVVVLRPETGEVLAYVGSVDYWNTEIGGAVDSAAADYPPGSLIRPYIYLTAFSQGYPPSTMTLDVLQTFQQGTAGDYAAISPDGSYRGPVSLREAAVIDAAPPAAQVMNWVGVAEVIRTAHRMGLNSLQSGVAAYDLSLSARGGDVTLADLTFSFGVFANGGRMIGVPVPRASERPGFRALDPVAVLRIEDAAGNTLWEYQPAARDTLDPALAYLVNHVLGDRELRVRTFGANNVFDVGRPAAIYAGGDADGTSQWAVGYTPQLVVGVWLGNTNRTPTTRLTAQNGPVPVWNAVLRYALQRDGLPVADWTRPPSIVEGQVCAVSGLLPNGICPVVTEVFYEGTQPIQQDTYYVRVEVNRENGRRATASTPPDLVEQRVYFRYPPEAQAWAAAQGIPSEPQEFDTIAPAAVFGPVAILSPAPLSYVGGTVEVRGNASLPRFQYYQLAYGQGLNPAAWLQIGQPVFTPARGALLGTWDTTGLNGLYSLRLQAVTADQTIEESVIQVTVDNTPPEVAISAPEEGFEVRVTAPNPLLDAAVTYRDNVGVTQVVYLLDGQPLVTVTTAPFVATIPLTTLGEHVLIAEASDAAGNTAASPPVTFTVRRGM